MSLSSCTGNSGETHFISFKDNSLYVLLGNTLTINFDTNIVVDDLTYTFSVENFGEAEFSQSSSSLIFTPSFVGESVLTLSSSTYNTSASTYIVVYDEDSETNQYELVVDTSKVETNLLIGEKLDTSNLVVLAYLLEDGARSDTPLYVDTYILDSRYVDTAFSEVGTYSVAISTNFYGSTSFDVNVSTSIEENYLSLDTTNVKQRYSKGEIFSRSGLVVERVTKTKTRENTGDDITYTETSTTLGTSEYSISPSINTTLDSNGWFDVIVTDNQEGLEASYQILVCETSSVFTDAAYSFINTKNIGFNVFSNFPTNGYKNGVAKSYKLKNEYYTITNYEKESLDDDSRETISNIEGGLKDSSNNLYKFELEGEQFKNVNLIKQSVGSRYTYWDYTSYFSLHTFKDFDINDFPVVVTTDDSNTAYQIINPYEYNDDYETSLSNYPLVETVFNLANIDTYYYRFIKGYEISVDSSNNIKIVVELNYFGEITLETISQSDNVDDEFVYDAMSSYNFKNDVDVEIDSQLSIIRDGIASNNYIRTSTYFTYYYNNDYVYFDYDPILVLYGISSMGLVKVVDSTKGFEDGIYLINGNLNNSGTDLSITSADLLTSSASLISSYLNYVTSYMYSYSYTLGAECGYASAFLSDLFNDGYTYSTFELLEGTSNFYLSHNADLGEGFVEYIGGSYNSSTLESYGYILASMVPTILGSNLSSLYLYSVDEDIYGYQAYLSDFGTVDFNSVNEYFGI